MAHITSLPKIMGISALSIGFLSMVAAYLLMGANSLFTLPLGIFALCLSIVTGFINRKHITELQMSVAGLMFSIVACLVAS